MKNVGFYSSEQHPVLREPMPESFAVAWKQLEEARIIAAVNNMETLPLALSSPCKAIYLLTGNPLTIPEILSATREQNKVCLANVDLLDGLARDRHAVEFLATHRVDGIVSTRSDTLKAARALGLITVQRTFAIDSAAIHSTIRSLGQFVPDAIEILPAMAAPKIMPKLHSGFPGLYSIGGGLIENMKEIEELLAAGVNAVSVSNPKMWII